MTAIWVSVHISTRKVCDADLLQLLLEVNLNNLSKRNGKLCPCPMVLDIRPGRPRLQLLARLSDEFGHEAPSNLVSTVRPVTCSDLCGRSTGRLPDIAISSMYRPFLLPRWMWFVGAEQHFHDEMRHSFMLRRRSMDGCSSTWFASKVWGLGAGGRRQRFRGDKRGSWEDGPLESGLVGRVSPSKGHDQKDIGRQDIGLN